MLTYYESGNLQLSALDNDAGCHQQPVYRSNSSWTTNDGTPALFGSEAKSLKPLKPITYCEIYKNAKLIAAFNQKKQLKFSNNNHKTVTKMLNHSKTTDETQNENENQKRFKKYDSTAMPVIAPNKVGSNACNLTQNQVTGCWYQELSTDRTDCQLGVQTRKEQVIQETVQSRTLDGKNTKYITKYQKRCMRA